MIPQAWRLLPRNATHSLSTLSTKQRAEDHNRQLEAYGYFLPIQTRWQDNDQYGHVNNAVYYSYFDTIINHYLIRWAWVSLCPCCVLCLGLGVEHFSALHLSCGTAWIPGFSKNRRLDLRLRNVLPCPSRVSGVHVSWSFALTCQQMCLFEAQINTYITNHMMFRCWATWADININPQGLFVREAAASPLEDAW